MKQVDVDNDLGDLCGLRGLCVELTPSAVGWVFFTSNGVLLVSTLRLGFGIAVS